jgi:hypothetical protein
MYRSVALLEWGNGEDASGPRLLGQIEDRDLVEAVRERLASRRRRELAKLEGHLRIVETPTTKSEDDGGAA